MLKSFQPENAEEFAAAMTVAYAWASKRKRFYPHVVELSLDEFIESQREPNKKQIGVIEGGQPRALITVWLMQDAIYDIHVIAPRKTKPGILLQSLLQIRRSLFETQGAQIIKTSYGIYRGHPNRGVKALAEACGMAPVGDLFQFADVLHAEFQEYQITKEQYVEAKTSHRKHEQ